MINLIIAFLLIGNISSYHISSRLYVRIRKSFLQMSSSSDTDRSPIADELIGWNQSMYSMFLDKYWQKKPVFIRQALVIEDCTRLSKKDVIDLVGNDDVESRLFKRPKGKKWDKSYGPFEPKTIESLPTENWSILIQEMDRHLPWVADLWSKYFNFVPLWRRDDIMFSYSASGGGIGAHVDNYDVFLVQGTGEKEWAIENSFVSHEDEMRREVPNVQTRLLSDFSADQKWTLQPGDMLYLPPRVPHRGVCLTDDCVTISVGFRAPTYESLYTAFCAQIVETTRAKHRFLEDATLLHDRAEGVGVGMISPSVQSVLADSLGQQMSGTLSDKKRFAHWLGRYLTTPLRMRAHSPQPFFLRSWREEHNSGFSRDGGVVDDTKKVTSPSQDSEFEFSDDDDEDDVVTSPLSVSGKHSVASMRVFESADEVISEFQTGRIDLRRLEGVRVATTSEELLVDGQAFPLSAGAAAARRDAEMLLYSNQLSHERMTAIFGPLSDHLKWLLGKLLVAGIWYPVDI